LSLNLKAIHNKDYSVVKTVKGVPTYGWDCLFYQRRQLASHSCFPLLPYLYPVTTSPPASRIDCLFLRVGTISLFTLYLVILAGSVVRATGSGMGCPDWPMCFGLLIPPTSPSEIEYHAGEKYDKGRMIVRNDTLWRAPTDLLAPSEFTRTQWEVYPEHNYAKFFVVNTWVEYINRLLGALSGLFLFIMLVLGILRYKRDVPTIVWLFIGMIVLGFVGWLGKVVVDTNLAPYKISMHMFSALVMVAIVIYVNSRVRKQVSTAPTSRIAKPIVFFLIGLLMLTVVQIYMGTQVRQQVDVLYKATENTDRESWIAILTGIYMIHQLMAVGIVLLHGGLYWLLRKKGMVSSRMQRTALLLLLVLCVEYGAGVIMHRFAIPAWIQPVHLLLATVAFGLQYGLLINMKGQIIE
jgi:cytochrome c oxidase assembly protein subunit 15